MYWITIAALIAVTGAEKLDRTYLPPPSAKTAGGNIKDLRTPIIKSSFNQGLGGIPKGSTTNEFDGVVVDADTVGTRQSEQEETGLGLPRPSYGSLHSKVGEAAFEGQQPIGFRQTPITASGFNNKGSSAIDASDNPVQILIPGFANPNSEGGGFESQQLNAFRQGPNIFPGVGGQGSPGGGFRDDSKQTLRPGAVNQQSFSARSDRPQAAQDRLANTVKIESDVRPDGFNYAFETDNGIYAEENAVEADGIKAQGGFSYKSDDGQVYSVSYTADKDGYQPRGDHLPTAPPIPADILKSLEQNAKDEAAGIVDDGSYDSSKYNAGGDYADSDKVNGQYNEKQLFSHDNRPGLPSGLGGSLINKNNFNKAPLTGNIEYNQRLIQNPSNSYNGPQVGTNQLSGTKLVTNNGYLPPSEIGQDARPSQSGRPQGVAFGSNFNKNPVKNTQSSGNLNFKPRPSQGSIFPGLNNQGFNTQDTSVNFKPQSQFNGQSFPQNFQTSTSSPSFAVGKQPGIQNQYASNGNGFQPRPGNQFSQNNRGPGSSQFGSAFGSQSQIQKNIDESSVNNEQLLSTIQPQLELSTPFESDEDRESTLNSNQETHGFSSPNSQYPESRPFGSQPTFGTQPNFGETNRPNFGLGFTTPLPSIISTSLNVQSPNSKPQGSNYKPLGNYNTPSLFGNQQSQFSQDTGTNVQYGSSTTGKGQYEAYYYSQPSNPFITSSVKPQGSRLPPNQFGGGSQQFPEISQESNQLANSNEPRFPISKFPSQFGQASSEYPRPSILLPLSPTTLPENVASQFGGITQASASPFTASSPTLTSFLNNQQTSSFSRRPSSQQTHFGNLDKETLFSKPVSQTQQPFNQKPGSKFSQSAFSSKPQAFELPEQDHNQPGNIKGSNENYPYQQYNGELYEYKKPEQTLPSSKNEEENSSPSLTQSSQNRPSFGNRGDKPTFSLLNKQSFDQQTQIFSQRPVSEFLQRPGSFSGSFQAVDQEKLNQNEPETSEDANSSTPGQQYNGEVYQYNKPSQILPTSSGKGTLPNAAQISKSQNPLQFGSPSKLQNQENLATQGSPNFQFNSNIPRPSFNQNTQALQGDNYNGQSTSSSQYQLDRKLSLGPQETTQFNQKFTQNLPSQPNYQPSGNEQPGNQELKPFGGKFSQYNQYRNPGLNAKLTQGGPHSNSQTNLDQLGQNFNQKSPSQLNYRQPDQGSKSFGNSFSQFKAQSLSTPRPQGLVPLGVIENKIPSNKFSEKFTQNFPSQQNYPQSEQSAQSENEEQKPIGSELSQFSLVGLHGSTPRPTQNSRTQFGAQTSPSSQFGQSIQKPGGLGTFGQSTAFPGASKPELPTGQSIAGKGEVFSGPRKPPSFDKSGYHY